MVINIDHSEEVNVKTFRDCSSLLSEKILLVLNYHCPIALIMPLTIDNFARVKYSLLLLRVLMIIDLVTDFALNKDKRYQEMLFEFKEYGTPLTESLYVGNTVLSVTLLILFSLEIIRVVVGERFAPLVFLSLVSIQVDIVWHFVNIGLDLWPLSISGLILSFCFNFLALVFAHMIYTKLTKVREFTFNKFLI